MSTDKDKETELLRAHIKDRGWKHWRVTAARWNSEGVTAYKTSEYGVQYTLRGKASELSYTIEHIETGLRA